MATAGFFFFQPFVANPCFEPSQASTREIM